MGSRLDFITIKGYKSIRELEKFPLGSLNILIGANGSGKSNFISTFRLLNQILDGNLQRFVGQSGGADALLYFGQKTTDEILLELEFGDNGYICSLAPAAGDTLIFGAEKTWYHNRKYIQPFIKTLGSGHKETLLFDASKQSGYQTMADYVIGAMKSWRVYHFHDTSSSAKLKQTGDINDNEILRSDASNLAAFLYLLQQTESDYYRNIVSTIRLVAPFFNEFNLRQSPLNPEKIQLEWRETRSDQYFNAHALSDGTLRFMCLAALLLQPRLPATILIDEPELGLHPYAITLLASLLRSAATQTQVIVSTQSVPLVNQFGPQDIIVVDRKDGQSTFEQRTQEDLKDWLDDYGMGDLWEKNLLGGRPQ